MIENEKIYDYIEYIIEALTDGTHEVTYFDVNESVVYNQYDVKDNVDTFSLTIELKRLPKEKKVNKINYEIGVKLDNSSVKDTIDALSHVMRASGYKSLT